MIQSQLYNGFREIWDFNVPNSIEEVVKKWKEVFTNYYKTQGVPIQGNINPNLYLSLNIFEKDFKNMIKTNSVLEQLEIIIQKLHYNIINGVNATGLWSTIPPVKPLILKNCFLRGNFEGTAEEVCKNLAVAIDMWVHTTKSINTISGVTVLWV